MLFKCVILDLSQLNLIQKVIFLDLIAIRDFRSFSLYFIPFSIEERWMGKDHFL